MLSAMGAPGRCLSVLTPGSLSFSPHSYPHSVTWTPLWATDPTPWPSRFFMVFYLLIVLPFYFNHTGWPSLGLVFGRTTTFKIMNTNILPLETTCHRPAHFVTSPQWQISLTSLEPLTLSGLPLLPPVTRYSHYGKQCGHSSETKK